MSRDRGKTTRPQHQRSLAMGWEWVQTWAETLLVPESTVSQWALLSRVSLLAMPMDPPSALQKAKMLVEIQSKPLVRVLVIP